MTTTQNKLTKVQGFSLAGCGTTFLINGLLALSLGSLMPYLRESYGFSYILSGSMLSMHSIGNLLSSFIAGVLPFRFGRRRTTLSLGCMGIVFYLLLLFCGGNTTLLLFAFFLSGVARGSCTNINNSVINLTLPGKAWAMNILHAAFAIGAFICPFMIVSLAGNTTDGWRIAVIILTVFYFLQQVIFASIHMPDNYPVRKQGGSDWGFLKKPRFLIVCAIMFFYMCVEQGVNGWLVTYFQDSGFLSAEYAQTMASILWLFILAGRLLCAIFSSRIPKEIMLCGTACGYAIFFFALLFARTLVPIVIFTMCVGFFMAGIYPTAMSTIGDICKESPLAMSIVLTVTGVGAIVMPSVIGFVADSYGIVLGMLTLLVAIFTNLGLISFNLYLQKTKEGY